MTGDAITDRLIEIAAKLHGFEPEYVAHSPSHERPLARVRHPIWFVLFESGGYTLERIGHLFGRDHSTVHSAISAVRKRIALDRDEAQYVGTLRAELENVRRRIAGLASFEDERRTVRDMAVAILAMAKSARVALEAMEQVARTHLSLDELRAFDEEPVITRGKR